MIDREHEAASSGAELVTVDGRSLPLVGARLVGEAQGGIARCVLEQRFENRYDETLRVTYRMPLPADGAVSAYEFEVAGRVIAGRVQRKAEARERFEAAIAQGRTAALLEQERADIFTQEIGNIPAGEAIIARITVDQRLVWLGGQSRLGDPRRGADGEWELRFPTVIGPRYVGVNDTAEDARATHVKVAPGQIGARISIELQIRDAIAGAGKPWSPTHTVRAEGGRVALHAEEGARLDRDVVVRWPVATREVGLSVAASRGETGGAYGLLTIVPPSPLANAEAVARDLIVLLDTSGSMGGSPLDKAKQVVALLIESLGDTDRLELIEFSNSPRRYKREPVAATAAAKRDAIKWVQSRQADGGTEMASGVREALCALRPGAQRQVVVVTDGYVGGEQQIVELLHGRLPESCRLHVLGVGAAVNRSLATALARAGRGVEVVAGIDEDPERPAARLIERTRSPVLVDVRIAGSALIAQAPERMPDVFAGAPIVAALALRPEGGELVVRGMLAQGTWEQRVRVPARRPGEGNQAFAALYARERVADLEARSTVGEHFDREIEGLGLEFQIATRLTSWIAIDERRKVAGPGRTEVMPQELPYGTSAASFGLRGGVETIGESSFDVGESSFEGSLSLDPSMMLGGPLMLGGPPPGIQHADTGILEPEEEPTSLANWGGELRSPSADAPERATKVPALTKTLLGAARPAVPKPMPMPMPSEQPVPEQVEPSVRKQAPVPAGPRVPVASPMKEAESLEMSKLSARRASLPSYRWSLLLLLLALISALLWWLVR